MSMCVDCGKRMSMVHRCPTPGSGKFDRDRQVRDITWYEATYHCGRCGQPGGYCLCTDAAPCGCAHLHAMGSGLRPDALDTFAEQPAVPVSDEQVELW